MSVDLEWCQNNGVLAVRPTSTGRLQRYHSLAGHGEPQVWVFAGSAKTDSSARTVFHGTYTEGKTFIAQCQKFGLKVHEVSFGVPFSNSKRDFSDKEIDLLLMREVPGDDALAILLSGDL